MQALRRISRRMVTQQRYNLAKIRDNTEAPKLKLFSNGNWMESEGSYERIPHPLDKRICIAEVPTLNLESERTLIKDSMQKVKGN